MRKYKRSQVVNIGQAIRDWLAENGYAGLCRVYPGQDRPSCTCSVDNLAPCGGVRLDCLPGQGVPSPHGQLIVLTEQVSHYWDCCLDTICLLIYKVKAKQDSIGSLRDAIHELLDYLFACDDMRVWEYAETSLRDDLSEDAFFEYLRVKQNRLDNLGGE